MRMGCCGTGVSAARGSSEFEANRRPGISGGTTLGATAAALFPDKVDKVILDGVMNAHEYYHKLGYVDNPRQLQAT